MSKQGLTLGSRYIVQMYWKKCVNSNCPFEKFSHTPNQKMKRRVNIMYHENYHVKNHIQ